MAVNQQLIINIPSRNYSQLEGGTKSQTVIEAETQKRNTI